MYMHWMIKQDTFVPLGLLHYFHAGVTRDQALEFMLESHKQNPKMFPRVDYRELDFWYTSFQNKNFDLNQEIEKPLLSHLENLPVLDHVIHQVGIEDQKSLCSASNVIKTMIDNENRLYELVEFRLSSNSILLKVEGVISKKMDRFVFKRKGNGCEIHKNKSKTMSELSMFENAFAEFKKTIEKVHTKVKLLEIKSNKLRVQEADRNQFFAGIAAVMSDLKEHLHVEEFKMTIRTPEELDTLLGFIKPGILEELDIDVHYDDEDYDDEVFEMSRVRNLSSHWSKLKNFSIQSHALDLKLEDFAHIPRVFAEIVSVTNEEIVSYKNKLLTFDSLRTHLICTHNIQDFIDGWMTALAPYDTFEATLEDDNEIRGSWPIPGNDNEVLAFTIDMFIRFSKKKID